MTSEAIRPDGVVIREITPVELKERLDAGDSLVLLDVREPFEKALADLPPHEEHSIPVKFIPFASAHLDPGDEIVVYCRSGERSSWATAQLLGMGFPQVLNLKGGILAWRDQVDPSLKVY